MSYLLSRLFAHYKGILVVILLLINSSPPVIGQTITLFQGRVTSAVDNESLPNVQIKLKGSSTGAVKTANDGSFSFRAVKGNKFIFSLDGYLPKEFTIVNEKTINISMIPKSANLTDVLLIGYSGSVNKFNQYGAADKVSNPEFKNTTLNTADEILQGRVAGVNVVRSTGEPGSDISVIIRGITSISGNNQPLYIVDGLALPSSFEAPVFNLDLGYTNMNALFGINPNDIERIDVLKDAALTAMYGARGANGVILITTKKGKIGESRIDFSNKSGIGSISNKLDMMNAQQFADVRGLALNTSTNTNWLDAITKTTFRQENALAFRGGVGSTAYSLSASYLKDDGSIKNSNNTRANARLNFNTEVKKWYTLKGLITVTEQKTNISNTQSRTWPRNGGIFLDALRAAPTFANDGTISQLDAYNGNLFSSSNNLFFNPVAQADLKRDERVNNQIVANIENIFYLTKNHDLQFHTITGLTNTANDRRIYLPPTLELSRNGSAQVGRSKVNAYNASVFLTHNFSYKKNTVNQTIGAESIITNSKSYISFGSNLNNPDIALENLSTSNLQRIRSSLDKNNLQSAFYRVNYNFDNKYIVFGSLRVDGSSRYPVNNKVGFFPAGAVAWNITEESFLKDKFSFLDLAKIRVSYGKTADQTNFLAYSSGKIYSTDLYETNVSIGGDPTISLISQQASNYDLLFETTNQFNVGADLGLFKNKLAVSAEFYNRLTKNLLQSVALPDESGYNTAYTNFGSIRNRGVELTITANPITNNNFAWYSSINLSRNRSTLLDYANFNSFSSRNTSSLGGNLIGGPSHGLFPGAELGLIIGYKTNGLYQKADFDGSGNLLPGVAIFQNSTDAKVGRVKFANTDGSADNIVNENDLRVIGNTNPDVLFGFNNNFKYKKINLNVLLTGSLGNDILNVNNGYLRSGSLSLADQTTGSVSFNQTAEWYAKRWTVNNQHNDARFPAASTSTNLVTSSPTSVMVEDGSYLRVKNVTVSYNFSIKSIKFLKSLNAFITGTDLLTITNYSGFDPEVSSYGNNPQMIGVDYGAYPKSRTVSVGVNIGL